MEWLASFIDNWGEYAGILALFVLTFDRIAKITPTKKDDEVVSMLYRVFAILGVKVPDNQGPSSR